MFSTSTVQQVLFLFCISLFPASLIGQNAFYTQDFANGIPNNWTSADLNNNPSARWRWCQQHNTGPNPLSGCPFVFNDFINAQTPFAATTASNGFAVFDSDLLGFNEENHNSFLSTAAIDCTNQMEVWLKFEMHIGVFEFPTLDNAVVEVSTDSVNFTTFPFIDLRSLTDPDPGIAIWSLNPHYTIIDISSVAANNSKVFIRWRWNGNFEYYWAIDDIVLYDEDPSPLFIPSNALRFTKFIAIPPNLSTPLSQADRFAFLADVKNDGLEDQTNVNLSINIKNTANQQEVFMENTNIGTIPADQLSENNLFPSAGYLPDRLGNFEGTYTVSGTIQDTTPLNNIATFPFEISTNTFAKEEGILNETKPDEAEFLPGVNTSWGWGNYFFCPSGLGYKASTVSFGLDGVSALADQALHIILYQWRDNNNDNEAQFEERLALDTTLYFITGFEQSGAFIEVDLNNGLGVPLDDDGEYIAMLEFQSSNTNNDLEIAFGNGPNYGGMILASELKGRTRHNNFLWIGNPDSTTFIGNGFGLGIVPAIRMTIDEIDALPPELSAADKVEINPNPIRDQIRVAIDLNAPVNRAQLSVLSTDGKILLTRELQHLKQRNLSFDGSALANGIYFLHLQTERGIRTKRFIVQRF